MSSHRSPLHDKQATTRSRSMESSSRPMATTPNPRPESHFPSVAFAPTPRRPPRSAFKRMLSRAIRKLKRYLDAKAEKYAEEQQAALPARAAAARRRTGRGMEKRDQHHARSRTPAAGRRAATRVTRTSSSQPSPSHLSSGSPALPLLRQPASTTTSSSLDAKGPFSASQKRILSRKLTTIRESSAEGSKDSNVPTASSRMSTTSYNDVDAASYPQHHGPTTPLPEQAEPMGHFPNLTRKHCSVDWARVDRRSQQDLTLLRNTEAMRDVSREAAAQLRASNGWVREYDVFDDRIWRDEASPRRSFITTIVNAANSARRRRHRRTPSGQSTQSEPSLSYSHSSLGSVIDSFPTPANVRHSLEADSSSAHRSNNRASPKTPVITISIWDDERPELHGATTAGPQAGLRMTAQPHAQVADGQANPASLRPPNPVGRLRGKQPWFLKEFYPPPRTASLPPFTALPVPSQPLDFFMERPLEIPESVQPVMYA